MKVTQKRGRLRLQLDPIEVEVLSTLLVELADVLGRPDDADPVHRRLYPDAYRDDDRSAREFRRLTEAGLREERVDRVTACAAEIAGNGDVDLGEPEVATRWIQVLNDLRLALGTRLGISEDEPEPGPDDPDEQARMLYHWLTAVQDSLVTRMMT